MEFLVKFWKRYVGRFGMFSLVLLGLENFLDDNFVCPCKKSYNQGIACLYFFAPAVGCLICTLFFVDLSTSTKNEEVVENEETVENEEMVCNSKNKGQRIAYSLLTVLIWLSLFLADGRYVACGESDWDGVFTKSDTFGIVKWCKPTGNETSEIESQQRTLELMFRSQTAGFTLMILVIILLGPFKCYRLKKNATVTGASSVLLRVFVSPQEIRRVTLEKVPSSVDELCEELCNTLGIQQSFFLQFKDPDFGNNLCNLTDIKDLPTKRAILKVLRKGPCAERCASI